MKVLHVCKTSDGAHWAIRQVAQLIRLGVEVHVALPNMSGSSIPLWRKTGATLHVADCNLPVNRPTSAAAIARRIQQLMGVVRPDLIHSHHFATTLMLRFALGRSHRIPRIFQVPGPLHLEHWHTRKLEVASSGPSDCWIASSEYIQELYRRTNVPRGKVFRSYHSTDSTLFSLWRTGYLRSKLKLPPDAKVVGNINFIYPPKRYLGQRVGLKRHEDVIEAISIVQRQRPNVWGVLIGGTFSGCQKYERRLRELAEKKGAGKILMPGQWSSAEVSMSWADFDCAVHVPTSENCGGVVEPLLSGVPTIAGKVGGLPEVVAHGLTGRLVPVKDPERLAENILEVLDNYDEEKLMALRGRKLVTAAFDPVRCATEVNAIYSHLVFGDQRPKEFSTKRYLETRGDTGRATEPEESSVSLSSSAGT